MEELENNEVIKDIENNIKDEEEKELPYDDLLLNDKEFLSKLTESILKQKQFISFIISQFKTFNQNPKDDRQLNLLKKIFSFINKNSEELGIPFFSLLTENEEFSNIIINFFYDNKFKEEIISMIKNIIEIFNFEIAEKKIKIPVFVVIQKLLENGIINQKDLKENEKRDSLSYEEELYVNIESVSYCLNNRKDNEKEEYYDQLLNAFETDIKSLKNQDEETFNSVIEYFQEKIKDLKNFKNKNKEKLEKKEIFNKVNKVKDGNKGMDDYNEEEKKNFLEKKKEDIRELRKKPLHEREYFYYDEEIIEGEDEYIEYKNYFFPLGRNQKEELKRQFCSFINSEGGTLFIGINDEKKVKGTKTEESLSYYQKKMEELMNNIFPKINVKEYLKFKGIVIKDDYGKIIRDLYVMRIIIKKGDPSILYSVVSTDNNKKGIHPTMRLQGQCANLTADEIHKEIIERNRLKTKKGNIMNDDVKEKIINEKNKESEEKNNKKDKGPENKITNNNDKNEINNKTNNNNNKNNINNNDNAVINLAGLDDDFINEIKEKGDYGSMSTKDTNKTNKNKKKKNKKKKKKKGIVWS